MVARQPHKLKVGGSSPSSATNPVSTERDRCRQPSVIGRGRRTVKKSAQHVRESEPLCRTVTAQEKIIAVTGMSTQLGATVEKRSRSKEFRKCGRAWLIAPVLKTDVPQGTVSSNLTASASIAGLAQW